MEEIKEEKIEYLSATKAAALIGYSTRAVIDWIEKGLIPASRPMGTKKYRIDKTKLLDFINQTK